MKIPLPQLAGAVALAWCASACQSTPHESLSEEEMMARWMEYSTPSEAHKVLNSKVGRWNLNVTMYMAPGAPGEKSTGTSDVKWVMDGRYLQDDTNGSSMGQPFSGHGLTGYDNLTHTYTGVWIDNMGTGILKSEGTYDPKTRTFHWKGQHPDFVHGTYVESRAVETCVDNDHWNVQMYAPDASGEEYLMLNLEYTRAR
jgi:hypothetical protein